MGAIFPRGMIKLRINLKCKMNKKNVCTRNNKLKITKSCVHQE
jgi:hypothetical protein